MNVLDLLKATLACGISAFLVYTYPVLSQALFIGLVSLVWLVYARKTLLHVLGR